MTSSKKQFPGRRTLSGAILSIGVGAALSLAGLASAQAQTMDYGSLEKLFGEAVTTSATGSPQRASDVPANMEIITADDIRRSGADNIPDILQFVAGVDVRRYGVAQAEVAIRGYNQPYSPRLLVLVNGRQVYLDDYGRTSWQSLPVQLDEIRQIEVVKGPNSALFGFNAVGGVINIITYDPLMDSANAVTVRGGTQQQTSGSAVVTLRDGDKAGLRLSAGGSRANEFSAAGLSAGNGPYNPTPYQFSFNADGHLKLSGNVVLTAEASTTQARRFDVLPTPVFGDNDYKTNSLKLGVAADTQLGLMSLSAYRNELHFDGRAQGNMFRSNNSVYVLQAADLFKWGADHSFRLGLEYRDNFTSGDTFGGKVGYDVYAASAMWNWQISPTLTLTNAVRFDYLALNFAGSPSVGSRFTLRDYNSATLSEPSVNSGFVFKPTDNDTFRLLASRGIQAPSLTDFGIQLFTSQGGVPFSLAGNPNLKAASVVNVELDYDRSIAPLGALLRTALYYQKNDSLLTSAANTPLMPGPAGLVSYSQNVGSSRAAGGEISLKGDGEARFRWNVSYAYIAISDRISLGSLTGTSSALNYAHGAPSSVVDIGAGYGWGRFEVDAQARWQSHFTDYFPSATGAISPVQIDDYVTMDARIGYRITDGLTLTLAGVLPGHARLSEAAGVPVERRVTVALTERF